MENTTKIITMTAEIEEAEDGFYAVNKMGPFTNDLGKDFAQKVADQNQETIAKWATEKGHPPLNLEDGGSC